MNNKLLTKRFIELKEQMQIVAATQKSSHYENFGSSEDVDSDTFLEWRVKVKNLIVKVCGEKSEHYKEFTKEEMNSSFSGNLSTFNALKAVFLATKEDYEGGFCRHIKT